MFPPVTQKAQHDVWSAVSYPYNAALSSKWLNVFLIKVGLDGFLFTYDVTQLTVWPFFSVFMLS